MKGIMKPIRVLHTEWSGGWGGQEIRIINEMLGVQQHGIEVHLACANHTPIYQKAKALGIPVHHLPFRHTADLGTLWGLMKLIRRQHIDLVNTHSGKDTWVGGLAAKWTGRKFIRTRHLSYPVSTSRLNFINEIADCVITAGEATRLKMIQVNRIKPDRIVAIPTGPNARVFDPSQYDATAIRKQLGIQPTTTIIGTVAFIRQMKRLDRIVDMATEIVKQHHDVKFIIVGDGSDRHVLEQQIQQRHLQDYFILPGMIENPAAIMSTFDIALLTSDRGEVSPQSLMQYLLMNIPTICTNVGSVGDFHLDDNFILVSPDDLNAIQKTLLELIDNPKKRQTMRLHCEQTRHEFVKRFSMDAMIEKTLRVYDKVLDRS